MKALLAIAAFALSLLCPEAKADTVTITGTWPAGQMQSRFTNINGPANAQQTIFTGYVSGPYNYILYPFTVNTTGVYTATSATEAVLNTTWFANGIFLPSTPLPTSIPATPLSDFIVAVLSAPPDPFTGTFAGRTYTAGQQYSVIVVFNTGSVPTNLSTLTMTGPGCVVIATNTCVPAEPTGATAVEGNAAATVTFTPPVTNGGLPITGYTVVSDPPGGVDINAGGTGTSHVVTGLAHGTTYTFTVVATNANGDSAASAPSNSVTPFLTSFTGPTGAGTGNATVSFTGGGPGCTFAPSGTGPAESAFFIPLTGSPKSPPAGTAPADIVFKHGLLDFVLVGCTPGATVDFTVTWPSRLAAGTKYYKYGPTPTDPTPHWYVLPALIVGDTVTFSIIDGGLGDDDLAANGTIVDQGGPGAGGAPSVPTLAEWALLLLALLVMGGGFAAFRRPGRA